RTIRRRDSSVEAYAINRDQDIPVRDAASQCLDLARPAGPPRHPIHQGGGSELDVHRCIAYRAGSEPTSRSQSSYGLDAGWRNSRSVGVSISPGWPFQLLTIEREVP